MTDTISDTISTNEITVNNNDSWDAMTHIQGINKDLVIAELKLIFLLKNQY